MKALLTILAALSIMTAACGDRDYDGWKKCVPEQEEANKPVSNVCNGEFTVLASDFTTDELLAIYIAQDEWKEFLGYEYVTFTMTDKKQDACQVSYGDLSSKKVAAGGNHVLGTTYANGSIEIDTKALDNDTTLMVHVMRHETGHALGFGHHCGSNMAPIVGSPFTEVDRASATELGF